MGDPSRENELARTTNTRITDVPARLQNLRDLLNSERHTAAEQRRAIEALDQEVAHLSTNPPLIFPSPPNASQFWNEDNAPRSEPPGQSIDPAGGQQQVGALQRSGTLHSRDPEGPDRYGSHMNAYHTGGDASLDRLQTLHSLILRRPPDTGTIRRPVDAMENDETLGLGNTALARSPSHLVRARRRATRPSERLTRNMRDRLTSSADPAMPNVIHSPHPPVPESPSPLSEHIMRAYANVHTTDQRSSTKRRKLEDGSHEDEMRPITYGDKGTVVPGQLKLQIGDGGGDCLSEAHISPNSWPQNLLQDDSSVFSIKSNRCNLLFRHASGMPFTLTKVVIKTPRSGYDAATQEGMIFVSLDNESLVTRTKKYEVQYNPRSYRYHRRRCDNRPSQDWSNATRSPLSNIDRSRILRDPAQNYHPVDNDPILESATVPGFSVTLAEPSDNEDAPTRSAPPSPRPWQGSDPEYPYRSYTDRYRPVYPNDGRAVTRYNYPSAPSSDSEADGASLIEDLLRTRRRSRDRSTNEAVPVMEYARRMAGEATGQPRSPPPTELRSDIRTRMERGLREPVEPFGYQRLDSAEPEPSTSATTKTRDEAIQEARRVSGETSSDTLAPHARFVVPRRGSVAVKFDPPVAGRYILVKVWAACPNANLDIQSITAHGYGGPRFFPITEMR